MRRQLCRFLLTAVACGSSLSPLISRADEPVVQKSQDRDANRRAIIQAEINALKSGGKAAGRTMGAQNGSPVTTTGAMPPNVSRYVRTVRESSDASAPKPAASTPMPVIEPKPAAAVPDASAQRLAALEAELAALRKSIAELTASPRPLPPSPNASSQGAAPAEPSPFEPETHEEPAPAKVASPFPEALEPAPTRAQRAPDPPTSAPPVPSVEDDDFPPVATPTPAAPSTPDAPPAEPTPEEASPEYAQEEPATTPAESPAPAPATVAKPEPKPAPESKPAPQPLPKPAAERIVVENPFRKPAGIAPAAPAAPIVKTSPTTPAPAKPTAAATTPKKPTEAAVSAGHARSPADAARVPEHVATPAPVRTVAKPVAPKSAPEELPRITHGVPTEVRSSPSSDRMTRMRRGIANLKGQELPAEAIAEPVRDAAPAPEPAQPRSAGSKSAPKGDASRGNLASILRVAQERPEVAPPPPDIDENVPQNTTSTTTKTAAPNATGTPPAAANANAGTNATNGAQPRRMLRRPAESEPFTVFGLFSDGGETFEEALDGMNSSFYGSYEFLFVKPRFSNATGLTDVRVGAGGATTAADFPFDHDFDLTPRVTLGLNGRSGFGARFRYWTMDQAAHIGAGPSNAAGGIATPFITPSPFVPTVAPVGPLPRLMTNGLGQFMEAQHSIAIDTYDAEATQRLMFRRTMMTLSGGVRYAQMEQRYDAQRFAAGVATGALSHDHDFEGLGPTIAAEWLHPVGESGLSFFANARGAVLFGERQQTASGFTTGVGAGIARQDTLEDAQVSIGEVGIGLQFATDALTFRAGYEGQLWSNVGTASSLYGDMGLHGISLSIGLSY